MTLFSPLEQFAIINYIPILTVGNLYLCFTNSALFFAVTVCSALLLVHCVTLRGGFLLPNAWQSLVEFVYEFCLNCVVEQTNSQRYFPFIFVTFTFLLLSNCIGMIPYSFTVTSHLCVTLGLSLSLFLGVTLIGFAKHGLHFFSLLLPAGVPLPLAPFLVLLELISYCFRALSLGIRLFANMMAGHSLVAILSGFAWTMLSMGGILVLAHFVPLAIVFALIGLEFGVAILQAYVFTILLCIYLNDAINLH